MGTHSMIGIWNSETGIVTASYCHYDGYLEGNGRTLVERYNQLYDAAMVATGGYLSGLSEYYAQDRLQSVHNDPAITYESVEDYMNNGYDHAGAEYLYLYDGSAWFVASCYGERRFTDVVTMLDQEAA